MARMSKENRAAALHHTREVPNMRSEFVNRKCASDSSSRGSDSSDERVYQARSARSTISSKSYQTAATDYSTDYFNSRPSEEHSHRATRKPAITSEQQHRQSDIPPNSRRPQLHHISQSERLPVRPQYQFFDDRPQQQSPTASVQSFTSTLASEEDFDEEPPMEYEPQAIQQTCETSNVIPAAPSDFSLLFPSSRTLLIHHDDTTDDGNMNLRLDTEVTIHGRPCEMQLFHLRLQDLRNRECSLRRYCRDSGREVCHTSRKQQQKAVPEAKRQRPGFSRSLSNALTGMRTPSGQKTPTLSRNDSGYVSAPKSGDAGDAQWLEHLGQTAKLPEPPLMDTIRLEFSNYAQAGVKRVGAKGSKRYDFEYWDVHYSWRRVVQSQGGVKRVSYYLTKAGSDAKLAHIIPVPLDPSEAQFEEDKGGWIPPCRMRIVDKGIINAQKDLSDVVVACGLMALVDDCIRTRLESQAERSSSLVPAGVQYIGPKRLITEMFGRKDSGSRPETRPGSSRQSSRQNSRPSTSSGMAPATVRQMTA